MSIDRILDLEKQFAGQAAYLDALASAIAAVETRQRRVDLEARLSDAPTARFGLFSGEGVSAAGSTEPGLTGLLADDSVTGDTIADGAINDIAKFASTIKPPLVVTSLPALPDALYPAGSGQMLFLTTTKRLYKTNDGTTWVAVTDAADLTGTITETQIADDAISTPKLQANVVTAAKIAAGTITANEIAADTITAGQIAAGAIGATEIAADAVTATKIAVGAAPHGSGFGLLRNPSFEEAPVKNAYYTASADSGGWSMTGDAELNNGGSVTAKTGSYVGIFRSRAGTGTNPGIYQLIPVIGGRRYRYSGWVRKAASGGSQVLLVVHTRKAGAFVTFDVIATTGVTSATFTFVSGEYTVPSDGSVDELQVIARMNGTPPTSELGVLEDLRFELLPDSLYNDSADVVIDSNGITINNGALTLADEFGITTMQAAGFSSSWLDFIHLGLYNARFIAGVTGTLPVGRTSSLPYWTYTKTSGSPTLTKLSTGGVRASFAALTDRLTLVSDLVAVRPAATYVLPLTIAATVVAGSLVEIEPQITYYDAAGTAIAGLAFDAFSASATISAQEYNATSVTIPATAFFASITLTVSEGLVHNAANNVSILAIGLREAPPENLSSHDLLVNSLAATSTVSASSFAGSDAVGRMYATGTAQAVAAATWTKYAAARTNVDGCAFTPAYIGQRWLITCSGAVQASVAAAALLTAIRLDTDQAGTLLQWLMVFQEDVPTVARYHQFGGAMVWEADRTTPVYAYFYHQHPSAANITLYPGAAYASQITAVALP